VLQAVQGIVEIAFEVGLAKRTNGECTGRLSRITTAHPVGNGNEQAELLASRTSEGFKGTVVLIDLSSGPVGIRPDAQPDVLVGHSWGGLFRRNRHMTSSLISPCDEREFSGEGALPAPDGEHLTPRPHKVST
jgi:hypothetical protein